MMATVAKQLISRHNNHTDPVQVPLPHLIPTAKPCILGNGAHLSKKCNEVRGVCVSLSLVHTLGGGECKILTENKGPLSSKIVALYF